MVTTLLPADFIIPNVFHSGSTLDGYSLVTGATALSNGAKLLGLIAESTSSSTFWVQVHDGSAQPANGAVPLVSIKLVGAVQGSIDCSGFGCLPMTNGIVIALSSTGPTYTAATASMWCTCLWI